MTERGYQYDFSAGNPSVFDREGRARKAATMVAVLEEFFGRSTRELRLLDVGAAAGLVDLALADAFAEVVGVDIDTPAIAHAVRYCVHPRLHFAVGDAERLAFADESFDVVLCAHVYEHVADPVRMLREIRRVLKPGGVCYFSAGNRFAWHEPHHHLPLLSVLPRPLAHHYLRLAGKGDHYHEQHRTLWGLRALVRDFRCHDYTRRLIDSPERYGMDYLLPAGSRKAALARAVVRWVPWLCPGYVWLLERPA